MVLQALSQALAAVSVCKRLLPRPNQGSNKHQQALDQPKDPRRFGPKWSTWREPDLKLENYMLESPVCVSLLNLARLLNVGERRRRSARCSGGWWEPRVSMG